MRRDDRDQRLDLEWPQLQRVGDAPDRRRLAQRDELAFDVADRAGQLILVRGALTRVGTKSFSHEMRLYEADSMTHCATQKTVEVCFDTRERKGVALPDDVRAKLRNICVSWTEGETR